jgi:hypothetical protein
MSFFKKIFESEEEEKERLELERRERKRAEEAAEAEGIEFPTVIDHNAEGHARADAAEAAVATARASARAAAAARAAEIAEAERAAEAAYAAEIAAEIPEAQKARKLLTEYWKKMNEYKARHMNADGLLSNDYSIQANRPNQNWEEVFDACQAAAAAYRYKSEHSQDRKEKELFEKKFYKYQSYGDNVYMSMRKPDDNIGMYNVQLGIFPSNRKYQGGKKSKYSRKSKSKYSRKSKSKYSRKSRTKYSRKSRSKYSRKY